MWLPSSICSPGAWLAGQLEGASMSTFNYMEDRKLYRRLNLLLYLNPVWNDQWGGDIQLSDKDVKHCEPLRLRSTAA